MTLEFKLKDDDFRALSNENFTEYGLVLDKSGMVSLLGGEIVLEFDKDDLTNFKAHIDGFEDFTQTEDLYSAIFESLLEVAKKKNQELVERLKREEENIAREKEAKLNREKDFISRLKEGKQKPKKSKRKAKGVLYFSDGIKEAMEEFDSLDELDGRLKDIFRGKSYLNKAEGFQEIFQGINPIKDLGKEFKEAFSGTNMHRRNRWWWENED